VAAPLLTHEKDLDSRAFAFMDLATKTDDQCLYVREDDGGRRGLGEDGPQCFALLSVHLDDASKNRFHAQASSASARAGCLSRLTPELTGAGGPTGPQGTNIGHQNREAMANVGVRVERFVRLGREARI